MATETVNQGTDDHELDALYEQVMQCEPAVPPHDMEMLADLVRNNERVGRQWRLTALLASKGGAFFRELSEDSDQAKALAPTVELLRDFAGLLRTMADLADCASSRVMVAGCNHEQFNEWAQFEPRQSTTA